VRVGWLVGTEALAHECWSQHDYITIGPARLSDRVAQVAVQPKNRERCYARTREILTHNLPIAKAWADSFGSRLSWTPPTAGAIGFMKYDSDAPSLEIADRVRVNQNTLIVPGIHVGMEGYIRIWLGAKEAFLREGLERIGRELTALFD
jgi:aspartate/methionine/tyrosine aminotransferase